MYSEYCIIFDMDGVLADTGPIHFESWVKMANEIGVEFTKDFFDLTFGQQSPLITRKLVGAGAKEEDVLKWANLKELYYREMVQDKLKPLPGVINLINELKEKGFKLAIGSSGPKENVELLLNSLKIKESFDVIITAAEVQIGKPAPDVFLIAAKHVQVNPENCIVIEDAPVGIEAARHANMRTIALTTTHEREDLKNADLIVRDLSEVSFKDIIELLGLQLE